MLSLLYAALKENNEMKLIPFQNVNIPYKKRGPPYQTDFISTKEEPVTVPGPSMVILRKSIPQMIIEVKMSVPVDFSKLDNHDCIELLIYCTYIMSVHKIKTILGTITDGQTWHTIKSQKMATTNSLAVMCYTQLSSTEMSIVVGNISKLLEL